MTKRATYLSVLAAAALVGGTLTVPSVAAPPRDRDRPVDLDVRFATFNASLNRAQEGQLTADLSTGDDQQARNVAETIQRTAPDVVLINEFDYGAELFQRNSLARSQGGQAPLELPHVFTVAVSTGVGSGPDLNGDGRLGTGDDAWGFGLFPGQYGMVVYSALPIDRSTMRAFQHQLWLQMPDSLLPWDHYGREIGQRLRLPSKSHWDIPVRAGRDTIHVLASHPLSAVLRRPRGSRGEAQPRRDPLLGRLHHRPVWADVRVR